MVGRLKHETKQLLLYLCGICGEKYSIKGHLLYCLGVMSFCSYRPYIFFLVVYPPYMVWTPKAWNKTIIQLSMNHYATEFDVLTTPSILMWHAYHPSINNLCSWKLGWRYVSRFRIRISRKLTEMHWKLVSYKIPVWKLSGNLRFYFGNPRLCSGNVRTF